MESLSLHIDTHLNGHKEVTVLPVLQIPYTSKEVCIMWINQGLRWYDLLYVHCSEEVTCEAW